MKAEEDGSLREIQEQFVGYSREWIRKAWTIFSYLGVDFSLEEVSQRKELIEHNISELKGIGSFWMTPGFLETLVQSYKATPIIASASSSLDSYSEEISKVAADTLPVLLIDFGSKGFKALRERSIPRRYWDRDLFLVLSKLSQRDAAFICSGSLDRAQRVFDQVREVVSFLKQHDVIKGWPMVTSGWYMVTPVPRHPASIVSDALRLGSQWAIFIGPNENEAVGELSAKLKELGMNFTAISGQLSGDGKLVMVNWESYPDPQSSDLTQVLNSRRSDKGLLFAVFGNLSDSDMDLLKGKVDGYAFHEGNSEFIEDKDSFIVLPYHLDVGEVPYSMWLFTGKDDLPLEEKVLSSLKSGKAVGIFDDGRVVGSAFLTNLARMLMADRHHLMRYLPDPTTMKCAITSNYLEVRLTNSGHEEVKGVLRAFSSSGIKIKNGEVGVTLAPGETSLLRFDVDYEANASGSYALALTKFSSDKGTWMDLSYAEVPPELSLPSIFVSDGNKVALPLTMVNVSGKSRFDVTLKVFSGDKELISENKRERYAPLIKHKTKFLANLSAGSYVLKASSPCQSAACKLIVFQPMGMAEARYEKPCCEGTEEVVLENESIKARIIPIGGRLIEFTLKEGDVPLLFKLYPKRPEDWRAPGRKRRFYPFGGLEEFIQQPTVEGHEPFTLSILRRRGTAASARAEACIHKNVLRKTFTLFGGSSLLQVLYEADFVNPELNVIGVNPIIRIGQVIDSRHVVAFPYEGRVVRERYKGKLFGKRVKLDENWIAVYDEQEKAGLITAYDRNVPFLTHIWMNTPDNGDSHYGYIEVQPWIKVQHRTTTYFSYYMYGFMGELDGALDNLSKLIPLLRSTQG
ncbi:MAG: hypothetical protein ACP5GO_04500 [Thermoprotei archaeon]